MAITQSNCPLGGPIIFGAAADKLDQNLIIREAIWAGCTTAAHVLKVVDYDSGTILYDGLGEANADKRLHGLCGQKLRNGIKITTMGSGDLLLYL